MADDVQQGIENALNKIVHTPDQSGNMKKELNKNIYETVSTLRNLVNRMKVMLEEEVRQKTQTEKENCALKTKLEASSRDSTKIKLDTSTERERELPKTVSKQVLPTRNHPQKLYFEIVVGREERKFQLKVKSKDSKTAEEIRSLLKTKVNPTEIKVGITSIRPLKDGRLIIEAGSKNEIEKLEENIGEKC